MVNNGRDYSRCEFDCNCTEVPVGSKSPLRCDHAPASTLKLLDRRGVIRNNELLSLETTAANIYRGEKSIVSEAAKPAAAPKYEEDAIYQGGEIVARVAAFEVRSNSSEIFFEEINTSDGLLLPEECEFQKYRILIQKIEYASRQDKSAPERGRVMRGATAEILGYREQ